MKLTKTWDRRLGTTKRRVVRTFLTVTFVSCTIVAISQIWGAFTNEPIDVAGPARGAVNRTDLIASFALGCIKRALTATQPLTTGTPGLVDDVPVQQPLRDCWTTHDPVRLPTTATGAIGEPRVSAITLQDNLGSVQQWSVILAVTERPYQSATPQEKCYCLPVLYTRYGPRATLAPFAHDCPGLGADMALGYPITLTATSPAFTTVEGFANAYLTTDEKKAPEGLARWVTTKSGLLRAADYRSAKLTKLVANHTVPDQGVPAEGTTVRVLAAVDSVDRQYSPRHEDYPLTLTVASGHWCVAALDRTPLLAADAEPTPVLPK